MGSSANCPLTQAKRLYIGNIPPTVTEDELKLFFRNQFISTGFAPPNSEVVQAVQIRYERNFAFIELEEPELATKGLGFDGISFQDYTLKVRRPRDYQGPEISTAGLIPGIVSTNVPDTPNKIFIGGLPSALTEDQVKELVGYFGELRAFHLVKDNTTNVSRGYAFFEYLDSSVTDVACRALNGKEIGGKNLLVQRAHLGSRSVSQVPFEMGNSESVIGCLLNLSMQVQTTLTTNDLAESPQPTRILVLMNMINFDTLIMQEKHSTLAGLKIHEENVRFECSKYGTIKSIIIPTAASEEEFDKIKGIGKILVEFETKEGAEKAQRAVALRKYNNRCVFTTYLDEELFLNGFYDGPEDAGTEQALGKLEQHFQNANIAATNDNNSNDNSETETKIQNYHSVPPPQM